MKNYKIYVNGQAYNVSVEEAESSNTDPAPSASNFIPQYPASNPPLMPVTTSKGSSSLKAPMPGIILNIKAAAGQNVKKGEVLLILEAMKMENEICAPSDGTITVVHVKVGQSVNTGDTLIDIA